MDFFIFISIMFNKLKYLIIYFENNLSIEIKLF